MLRYFITDRRLAGGLPSLLQLIERQMSLGVEYIQIREKDLAARELFAFTREVVRRRELLQRGGDTPARILVNHRTDVALAAGADGVHLPASAPREVPSGLLVFRSCHTLEEVRSARCDAVTLGPVFASPGKDAPIGPEALLEAVRVGPPVFALGGVTLENASLCLKQGAVGIAGIRLFLSPPSR